MRLLLGFSRWDRYNKEVGMNKLKPKLWCAQVYLHEISSHNYIYLVLLGRNSFTVGNVFVNKTIGTVGINTTRNH